MTDIVAQQVHAHAPWQIPARGWWQILKRVYGKLSTNHISLLSAGVAYYAFLSIAPLLLAVVLTYGLIGDPQLVADNVRSLITVVPQEAAKLIYEQLMAIVTTTKPAVGLGLIFALAFAVYGATRASSATIEALNIIYEQTEARSIFAFYRVVTEWVVALWPAGYRKIWIEMPRIQAVVKSRHRSVRFAKLWYTGHLGVDIALKPRIY